MKYLIPIVLLLVAVGSLVAVKASQIGVLQAAGEKAKLSGPPPETVSSTVAKKEQWGSRLTAVGSVAARKGVTISNDAAGLVAQIHFDSGERVKAGKVLVTLDSRVERAQLKSAEARLGLATTTVERTRALTKEGISTQAELDTAEATLEGAEADVSTLRAQIARKVIVAPFDGQLGIRMVNEGQYLAPGSDITTLQSEAEEYVDFELPQQHLEQVSIGLKVHFSADEANIDTHGVVAALNPIVNPATRAFEVRATASDDENRLRPGMFVNVMVQLGQARPVVTTPSAAVVHAPYGDSVFLIEEAPEDASRLVARQQFVQLGESRGDWVEVKEGLQGGEKLVFAGAFKLRNGSPIVIDDSVDLDPRQNPHPKNR